VKGVKIKMATINQVSQKFDLTKDTLRYWERLGLLPEIQRNGSGYRDYSEYDMNWVFYVKALRKAGMSIEALTQIILTKFLYRC
jgi:DNA-binding transcriptional MerR regulator